MTLVFSHLNNSRMQSRLDIVLKPYFPMWYCFYFLFFSNKNLCSQSNSKGLLLITLLYGEGKCEDPLHIIIITCVMQNSVPHITSLLTVHALCKAHEYTPSVFSRHYTDLLWTQQEANKLTRLLWRYVFEKESPSVSPTTARRAYILRAKKPKG